MTVTKNFGYTGGWQTYTIPDGITTVSVTVDGAGSGTRGGARITGSFAVSGGQVLYLAVGGQGGATGSTAGGGGGAFSGGAGGSGVNTVGGYGGGGYSAIRISSTTGSTRCIAGGAGGDSGDHGAGGVGGSGTGGRGSAGSGSTTNATGGSSGNGGSGGTSSSGSQFAGSAGGPSTSVGGHGGNTGGSDGPGGGGGGGGYGSGGGGCGGSSGFAPGGGGGGGGSLIGAMSPAVHTPGGGGAGNGSIQIVHADPVTNNPPYTPQILAPADGQRTLSTGSFTFSAKVSDPNGDNVHTIWVLANNPGFTGASNHTGTTVVAGGTSIATISGLTPNQKWYVRCYAVDSSNAQSAAYDSASFYTNYNPDPPTSVTPVSGAMFLSSTTVPVSATLSDPDGTNVCALFRVSTDNFATYTDTTTAFVASGSGVSTTLTGLTPNSHYSVLVYAQDAQGAYSTPVATDFWTNQNPTAATLVSPANNENFDSTNAKLFSWVFNDPDPADTQSSASFRYRRSNVGDPWITSTISNSTSSTLLPANSFTASTVYEWQIQTTDSGGLVSPWTNSSLFTASPPSSSMSSHAGMSLASLINKLTSLPLTSQGKMNMVGMDATTAPVPLASTGRLTVSPIGKQLSDATISTSGQLLFTPMLLRNYSVSMSTRATLLFSGSDLLSGIQNFSVISRMAVQLVLGDTSITTQAVMLINPSMTVLPSVNMSTLASLGILPSTSSNSGTSMLAVASLADIGSISRSQLFSIVVKASVSDSGALSQSRSVPMATRGFLTAGGLSSHLSAVVIHTLGQMVQIGKIKEVSYLSLNASARLTTIGSDRLFTSVPLQALGSLGITPQLSLISPAVIMNASAELLLSNDSPLVYEGPYLIVPGINGSVMFFSATGFPNPRSVRNNPSVLNQGSISP